MYLDLSRMSLFTEDKNNVNRPNSNHASATSYPSDSNPSLCAESNTNVGALGQFDAQSSYDTYLRAIMLRPSYTEKRPSSDSKVLRFSANNENLRSSSSAGHNFSRTPLLHKDNKRFLPQYSHSPMSVFDNVNTSEFISGYSATNTASTLHRHGAVRCYWHPRYTAMLLLQSP